MFIHIDEWWNTPLWHGKNADGRHQCPKGPRDASNWAWISHRPSIAEERWRVIPWFDWWAIRYEPIGWSCQWMITEVFLTEAEAKARIKDY